MFGETDQELVFLLSSVGASESSPTVGYLAFGRLGRLGKLGKLVTLVGALVGVLVGAAMRTLVGFSKAR